MAPTRRVGHGWITSIAPLAAPSTPASATLLRIFSAPSTSLPLAAGGSYSTTQSVNVGDVAAGNYFLFVVTNADKGQNETNTTNDVSAAVPITVTSPDLTVTTASASESTASLGTTLPVSWTVANIGADITSGFWYDAVYVSSNQTLDSSATFVTNFYEGNHVPLANGGSYSDTQNITLPSTATGSRYLLFVANSSNSLPETNQNNNVFAVPITLTAPDLVVTQATAPSSGLVGQTIPISWTVQNQSTVDAAAQWYDAVYISPDNVFDSNARFVSDLAAPAPPLAAGASYTQSQDVVLPSTFSGPEFLLFVTDAFNQQPETNETNNVLALPINVSAADLTVTSVTAPASGNFGQPLNVSWTVQNAGTGPASQNWNDGIFFSTKNTLDGSAVFVGSVPAGSDSPLAAGASYTHSTQVKLPLDANSTNGTYFILVVADYQNQQLETNETNNRASSQPIDVTLAALPDLAVSSITPPASGLTGQSAVVSWMDVNNGTAAANGPWGDNLYLADSAQGTNPVLVGSFPFSGSLAAGASVERSQSITLPSTPGNYWVLVTTNANGAVPEGPLGGNDTTVSSSPISVIQAPLPDLVVTGITPPLDGVLSGTSVPVSFVVTNEGTAPTTAPVWQDVVILSQDPNLGQTYTGSTNPTGPGSDQTLNNQPVVLDVDNPSFLDIGQSYTQTVNVSLPISAQGTWYVYVVPDGTGFHHPSRMMELSRTDKLALSTGFAVALSPPPELVVTSVQAPPQDFSGQPMSLRWTVTDQGTGATSVDNWTDAVYMSSTSTLDSSAILLGQFDHQGTLVAGSSYTNTETVNLPVGVSGPFFFIVKTDSRSQVFQNGQTAGNVGATPAVVTVNLTPPPDLSVGAITAPSSVLASHTLNFSYQVTNAGATATPNTSWTDSYYLSPTATFDASTAILLGQQTHQGALNAGDSDSAIVAETVPNGLSGQYFLIVDADSANAVFELNKTNNFGASAAAIQVSSQPADLAVTAASAPPAGAAGAAMQINWTVANQGTGDTVATSWQDNVYVEVGTTLDNSAILLGSFTHTGLLNAGQSYTQSQLVSLPINLSGPYHFFVVTNQSAKSQSPPPVYDLNTANDVSSAIPINITQQLADLLVTSVTVPTSAATGDSVTVNWTVANNGAGITNSNYWYDDVWASTGTTLGSGGTDVYLGSLQRTNPLTAGASYAASLNVTLPQTLTAGSYHIIVATDRPLTPPNANPTNPGTNLVFETNEDNNETTVSAATAVSSGAVPDLSASGVTAPTTANSGQPLALIWSVTNNGADTGNVPINDSVFLSLDQIFDPRSDRYLGTVSEPGGLASGASYTQNASLQLPAGLAGTFYAFVVTNSDHGIFERNTANNAVDAAQPVAISLPAPADLVAGTVTVPANAVPGQNITISYQVTNNGTNPANGVWYDSLYLSPTPTWSISDPLLGRVFQSQNLAANGGSYTGTLTAPLPGVTPGSYYVIVRTNILANLPEVTLANNLSASLTQTSIDVPALALGTPTAGTLGDGQAAFYKVTVAAGQTLQISFNSQMAAASNELYVSFGTMPSRSQFDFRYSQPFTANQQITIATTQAGTYYILAYGQSVPTPPENYTITAALIPFSITAVNPGTVGNAGLSTIEILGAQFDRQTTFELHGPGGAVIPTAATRVQDSATAFVTFDLSGAAVGAYDVVATPGSGSPAQLTGGLTVEAGQSGVLATNLIGPPYVLPSRIVSATETFGNSGGADIGAPLIFITSTTGTNLGLTADQVPFDHPPAFLAVRPGRARRHAAARSAVEPADLLPRAVPSSAQSTRFRTRSSAPTIPHRWIGARFFSTGWPPLGPRRPNWSGRVRALAAARRPDVGHLRATLGSQCLASAARRRRSVVRARRAQRRDRA